MQKGACGGRGTVERAECWLPSHRWGDPGPVGTDCTGQPARPVRGLGPQPSGGVGQTGPLGAECQALEPEAANVGFVFTQRPAPAV